jgi:hypothetical protein
MAAIAQFKALAKGSESSRPTCSDVKRLLEVAGDEKEELENFVKEQSREFISERPEGNIQMIYGDGDCVLWRAPNGQYIVQELPTVSGYTDFDKRS